RQVPHDLHETHEGELAIMPCDVRALRGHLLPAPAADRRAGVMLAQRGAQQGGLLVPARLAGQDEVPQPRRILNPNCQNQIPTRSIVAMSIPRTVSCSYIFRRKRITKRLAQIDTRPSVRVRKSSAKPTSL